MVRGNHKKSGLSAGLLGRMLKSPRLPASVRSEIIDYIEAKVGGSFGHNKIQLRRFRARLKTVHLKISEFDGPEGKSTHQAEGRLSLSAPPAPFLACAAARSKEGDSQERYT
jgi:hypothetical protein